MLALWNREWHWPEGRVDTALVVLVVAATAVVARPYGSSAAAGRGTLAAVSLVAVFVLAWNMTNEIYAAYGEYDLSERMSRNFTQPHDWVDRAAGDGSVTLVGQQFGTDYNGIHLLEFWNRSIDKVWSVDPASPAPGPGPTQTPDLIKADGTLWPSPDTDYALAVNGVALQSPVAARDRTTGQTLYRLDNRPLKLRYSQSGVFSDGWMSEKAAYNRFDLRPDELGLARVELRQEFCATNAPVVQRDGQARALTGGQRPATRDRTRHGDATRRNRAVRAPAPDHATAARPLAGGDRGGTDVRAPSARPERRATSAR